MDVAVFSRKLLEKIEFETRSMEEIKKKINEKVKLRNKAREKKDYAEADRIRDDLLENGIEIEDKDGKTTWKFK